MTRALDHLVIPARDLAAQAELYRRLGFQVGARNRHPWGTENHIVQFDGAFLELIGLGEGFTPPAPRAGEFSFARFVSDYLESREGLGMLVLRSADAEADRRTFAARGIGEFERFDFARKAKRPSGEIVDVAFSLAFAAAPEVADTGFFVCQQHYPENFWSAAAQVHPNGALGVSELTYAHARPGLAADFLERFLDAPRRPLEDGYVFAMQGARLICAPAGVRRGLTAMRIRVASLDPLAAILDGNGLRYARRGGAIVIGAADAMGVDIVFGAD